MLIFSSWLLRFLLLKENMIKLCDLILFFCGLKLWIVIWRHLHLKHHLYLECFVSLVCSSHTTRAALHCPARQVWENNRDMVTHTHFSDHQAHNCVQTLIEIHAVNCYVNLEYVNFKPSLKQETNKKQEVFYFSDFLFYHEKKKNLKSNCTSLLNKPRYLGYHSCQITNHKYEQHYRWVWYDQILYPDMSHFISH